ncbi:hypothetical protein HCX48_00420 [Rhodocyclus tenuis]|uniref:DUF2752 domain-containing protein n=1 Tax=Rhodocyclus gracilis TaxID=2929842 RepID=A0ABX0WFN2_9RHOO|nr:hypothetical protein [Rhodocyclus gracilis]MRD73308.1 hypothetical protein [Rhodocyclus gracilis]NJA87691.1 hypothetical protein [Rhodocyclus gracilis]
MRTRCPSCGATLSLDALVAHDGAREAMAAVFKLSGALGAAVVRYLALFRPETRELTMDRVGRLLGDILPDIQAQRISRDGQVFDAPADAWIWAIEQSLAARDAGRLKTPLKGHGWLYEVISSYRPQTAHVVADGPLRVPSGKQASRTLTGIAALEDFKRGG